MCRKIEHQAADSELTLDEFLGGSIRAWQPARGFRAGIDSGLLAGAIPAEPGQEVLELGCGVGVAALCLLRRVAGAHATGLEVQPQYAELAQRNARLNGFALEIFVGDVADPPGVIKSASFGQVCANPPYHRAGTAVPPADRGRAASVIEQVPLSAWVGLAFDVLDEGGWLTMILPSGRHDQFMSALPAFAGTVLVKPVVPHKGKPANRILVRARKGGRRKTMQIGSLILHELNGGGYTAETEGLLRGGNAVPFRL